MRYQEQEKIDQSHEIAQLQSDLSDMRRDNYNLRQNYESVKRNLDRLQEVLLFWWCIETKNMFYFLFIIAHE